MSKDAETADLVHSQVNIWLLALFNVESDNGLEQNAVLITYIMHKTPLVKAHVFREFAKIT